MIRDVVKDYQSKKDLSSKECSDALKLKHQQAFSNKLARNSFSIQDCIKLAALGNCVISFQNPVTQEAVATFHITDLDVSD